VLIAIFGAAVLAYVWLPLMRPVPDAVRPARPGDLRQAGATSPAGVVASQADELMARREAIYATLKDAEFDRELGKLTAEDYQAVRTRYVLEAAQVLRQLDRLTPEAQAAVDAEIEQAVAALRQQPARGSLSAPELVRAVEAEVTELVKHNAASRQAGATCPDCGRAFQPGDAFCTACGAPLADLCPQCGTPRRSDDGFCARCGAVLHTQVHASMK
jgi:hypothetical protein